MFISHACPDKLTLAEPRYKSLAWHNVHAFLDMEGLQISEDTVPEVMVRAMSEARVGNPYFVSGVCRTQMDLEGSSAFSRAERNMQG